MSTQYRERVKMLEIGTTVADIDITAIKYFACKPMSDGPGGHMLEPRLVPNTVQPVDVRQYHKWWQMIVGFDYRMKTVLFETDVEEGVGTGKAIVINGDNTPIGLLRVTLVKTDGSEETWTFETSKSWVADYSGPQIRDGEQHQIAEVMFICIGSRT